MQNFINKIKDLFSLKKKNRQDNNISNEEKEIDPLEALSTLDQKTEDIRKKTLNRFVYTTLILTVGLFLLNGLIKFFIVMSSNSERKPIKTKTEKVGLKINTFSKWQYIKDQQIKGINTNMKNMDSNLTKKIHVVEKKLKHDINNTTNKILVKIDDTQKKNSELITSVLKNIKKEIKKSELSSKQYADTKNINIEDKIRQIEKNSKSSKPRLDFSKLSLPKLPSNITVKNNKIVNNNKIVKNNKITTNDKKKYKEIEENIVVAKQVIKISTLDKTKMKKSSLPTFTIMPGFTKATIITGAAVPTLTQAQSTSRPVWLSFNGETLIANNDTMDVGECLIEAAATGDFSSGVAEIRLSKISCSATDKNGQKYKLISPVKGWVYSEIGQYGLKGRLVSKEGTIIEKAIPLTVLEGLTKAMSNLGNSGSNALVGTQTTTPGISFRNGATSGADKALGKISDYYLKILASLNPVIEIKAGRQVVVAFAGGEKVKFKKYTPADVSYFEGADDE